MERESLLQTLMRRDGLTPKEAQDLINEAKEAMQEYVDDGDYSAWESVCEEFFGLEPDYLDDLI